MPGDEPSEAVTMLSDHFLKFLRELLCGPRTDFYFTGEKPGASGQAF